MTWLVTDMDDGVLREEPTRKAAVEWLLGYSMSPRVRERFTYGIGYYGYVVGIDREDASSYAILRENRLDAYGLDPQDPKRTPLYPYPDPWLRVDRETSETNS